MRATLRFHRRVTWLATAGLAALAAACGGGDGMNSMPGATAMGCMSMSMSGDGGMSCMAPTVTLQSPGASVHLTVRLSASVTAVRMDDRIMQVDFLVDGAPAGTATMAPYTIEWDSTTVSDGTHTLTASAVDSMGMMATSAPLSVSVDNNPSFAVSLSPAQLMPAPTSAASGTASLAAKLASGALSGQVMLSGMAATAVTLNEAFAGNSGAPLITLRAGAGSGQWDLPAGALLSSAQVTALLQGRLYLIAASAAHPGGEVRGQITPAGIMVSFAGMDGAQEVPPVSIAATGSAAVTVDTAAGTLSVHVHAAGVDDAMAAAVDDGAMGTTGGKLSTLAKDPVDPGHWSTELAAVSPADIADFEASRWYVNLATPAQPAGAIRGQIDAPAP
ncbi:MAG TPA: CHRD domain-containing protein [Steroidobacteraceae bacterium]|nr:CHRD domain-containing protein [Steroidobacteraceae bacterium]